MAEDKRLETMQEEIKLLKGEVKQSLASVRDYLLNMELPSSEFSTILAALGTDGTQRVTIDGNIGNALANKAAEAMAGESEPVETTEETIEDDSDAPSEDEDLIDVEKPPEDKTETMSEDRFPEHSEDISSGDELVSPEDALEEAFDEPEELGELEEPGELEELGEPEELGELEELGEPEELGETEELGEPEELGEQDESMTPESEISEEEEQPVGYDKTNIATTEEVSSAIPKVNMLANLINWVARAKEDIGYEQLSTFLEVYGISGHLSPELKEMILHLSQITTERPEVINNSEIWSQSMLSLHGILTGGDAPLHPVIPSFSEDSSEEEIIEVDKAKESPVKLKLVFPNGDGKSKEFCIDLNPEVDDDDSSSKRKN